MSDPGALADGVTLKINDATLDRLIASVEAIGRGMSWDDVSSRSALLELKESRARIATLERELTEVRAALERDCNATAIAGITPGMGHPLTEHVSRLQARLRPEPRFVRPEPPASCVVPDADRAGFRSGAVTITWLQPAEAFVLAGRAGRVFTARVTELHTQTGRLGWEDARAMLHGAIVRAPDGVLSRITGVETLLTFEMMVDGPGGEIGLLLVPVDEP